jgi:polar amino acid transport system substrate-binding protein
MKTLNPVTFCLLALSALFVGCGKPASVNEAGQPTLRVACEPTFPPFEMLDEQSGEIVGFDIDLITAVAAEAGYAVEIKNLGFDGLIPALQTGAIDVIASGMTITEERGKQVAFTNPYIDAGISVAIGADSALTTLADLKGKKVAVQLGTSGAEAAAKLATDIGGYAKLTNYESISLAFQELANGTVDAVINDTPVNQAFAARYPGKIKFLGEPLNSETYGFAVNLEEAALLEALNAGLDAVKASGAYDTIADKYFK